MRKISIILFSLILLTIYSRGQSNDFFDRVEITTELLKGINTTGSEISPAIVKDELYFSSMREELLSNQRVRQQSMQFYNVYKTFFDADGYTDTTRQLVPGLGNFYHEGPVSWCQATGELFVTVSNITDGDTIRRMIKEEVIRLRLVIMHELNGRWTIRQELPFNQDKFHFAHPAISVTGDTLVFSSDLAGGFGKSDLYISVRTDGIWSHPRNLGSTINTVGNEMFPVFGPGGLLLFSSDGHDGNVGQLDIYYTTLTGNSAPVHLGEPVNSSQDDFGLIVHPSGRFGYFSSSRPGSGSDDIYLVTFKSLYENIAGNVVGNNGYPLRDAIVHLEDCGGTRLNTIKTDIGGNFIFEVTKGNCHRFVVEKEGFLSESKSYIEGETAEFRLRQRLKYHLLVLDAENSGPLSQAVITCNDQKWQSNVKGYAELDVSQGSSCVFRVTRNGYFDYVMDFEIERFSQESNIDTIRMYRKGQEKVITMNNMIYYRDMWRIMPESEKELSRLVKLMKDNPGLRIEVGSHTDSRLADDYNLWLSQKRSDSITEFLIEQGIEKERLISKGYGETQLINHCTNWVDCKEEEHLVNRRTEFRIITF